MTKYMGAPVFSNTALEALRQAQKAAMVDTAKACAAIRWSKDKTEARARLARARARFHALDSLLTRCEAQALARAAEVVNPTMMDLRANPWADTSLTMQERGFAPMDDSPPVVVPVKPRPRPRTQPRPQHEQPTRRTGFRVRMMTRRRTSMGVRFLR